MDHEYQQATEARQTTGRWPVVVGLMSAFAGGALSATMLQHNAKRGDPMLLGATTPPFKAPTMTSIDEFIGKGLVPGPIVVLQDGKSKTYPSGYVCRSLVQNAGSSVGVFLTHSYAACFHACDTTKGCNSIAFDAPRNQCVLNDRHIGAGDAASPDPYMNYESCYRPAGTCASCVTGSYLNNNQCNPNVCHCPHGTETAAPTCPHNGDTHCSSCDANYRLVGSVCKRVVCHCLDGRGARGAACPSHKAYKCTSCNPDYHLVGIKCVPNFNFTMLAIRANESTN